MRLDMLAAVMLVSFIGYYCGEFIDTISHHHEAVVLPEVIVHDTHIHAESAEDHRIRTEPSETLESIAHSLATTHPPPPPPPPLAKQKEISTQHQGFFSKGRKFVALATAQPKQAPPLASSLLNEIGEDISMVSRSKQAAEASTEVVGSVSELSKLLQTFSSEEAGKDLQRSGDGGGTVGRGDNEARVEISDGGNGPITPPTDQAAAPNKPPPPPPPPPPPQTISPWSSSSSRIEGLHHLFSKSDEETSMQKKSAAHSNIGIDNVTVGLPTDSSSTTTTTNALKKSMRSNKKGEKARSVVTTTSTPSAGSSGEGSPPWKLKAGRLGKGVFLLHDVCIEEHPDAWTEVKKGSCPHRPDKSYRIEKRIVVYNSKRRYSVKDFKVGGHGNRKNLWEIHYEIGPPPKARQWAPYPALFATTSCEANLHHFLVDQFSRIYAVMKTLGRLGTGLKHPSPPPTQIGDASTLAADSSALETKSALSAERFEKLKVMLFYRDDVHDFCRDTGCHDPTKFEDLLFTLPFVDHRAYFAKEDTHLNVCFRDAVLGTSREGVSDREVSNHILQGLGMAAPQAAASASAGANTKMTCPTDPERTVVILQRRNRRLLNAQDLAAFVETQTTTLTSGGDKGPLFARVVEFDGMNVTQQMFTVRCCKLFVAVMGAGQQWVSFMRKGSTLLSIGWRNWNADYYKGYAKEAGVTFVAVETSQVVPNFEDKTVVKFFGENKLKAAAFRKELQATAHKQVAKASDVTLPTAQLMLTLKNTFKLL